MIDGIESPRGQRQDKSQSPDLGIARFMAALFLLHAAFGIVGSYGDGMTDPAADDSAVWAALSWAIIEHPGRTALALALLGWALWNPRPCVRRPQETPGAETIPPSGEGDSWAIGL